MKFLHLVLIILFPQVLLAQKNLQKESSRILNEAKFLYRIEKANWLATDILIEKNNELLKKVKGYAAYNKNENTIAFFWDQEQRIIFSVGFNGHPEELKYTIYREERTATAYEKKIISMRNKILDAMRSNSDKFFSFYEGINPNIVPILNKKESYAYVLSASNDSDGNLLIGNDYKIVFNKRGNISQKKKLHNSLIKLPTKNEKTEKIVGSIHSHVIEDLPYMTATDICTFMLYKDILGLTNHTVVSKKYYSIFDAENRTFIIITSKAMEKINSDQEIESNLEKE